MPRFVCLNEECEDFEKEILEIKVSYKYIGMEFICDKGSCPKCGVERKGISEGVHINFSNPGKKKWRLTTKGTIY